MAHDLQALDDALNTLAALYQFRNPDHRVFGTLTVSQSYRLRILYFQSPRSMGSLATEMGVRLSTMTGIIDQLEDKLLVERVDHPDDRRSLHVTLTPKGRKLYHTAHEAFLSHLEMLFAGRSATAREEILKFLDDTIQVIHGWRRQPEKIRSWRRRPRKVQRDGKVHS